MAPFKIYLIERKSMSQHLDYYVRFVVSAENETIARDIVGGVDEENRRIWEDEKKSTCREIGTSKKRAREVFVEDFWCGC